VPLNVEHLTVLASKFEHFPALPRVVLVEPEIPPNVGNIGRFCAAMQMHLLVVGRTRFTLDDKTLKRAGLDYWPYISVRHIRDKEVYLREIQGGERRAVCFSTKAETSVYRFEFSKADDLIFGSETTGLPPEWISSAWGTALRIPMTEPGVRSLNLSSAVAVVAGEALRQLVHR